MISLMMKNEAYIGRLVQGKTRRRLHDHENVHVLDKEDWVVTENAHQPLVSQEIFDRANALSRKRWVAAGFDVEKKRRSTKGENKYIGIIRCGFCGRNMRHGVGSYMLKDGTKKRRSYYSCCNVTQHQGEGFVSISEMKLDKKFMDEIRREVGALHDKKMTVERYREEMDLKLAKMEKRIRRAKDEAEGIQMELFDCYEAFSDGKVTAEEYRRMRSELEYREKAAKQKISDLEDALAEAKGRVEAGAKWIKSMYRANGRKTLERELVQSLVGGIGYSSGGLFDFEWRFAYEGCSDLHEAVEGGRSDP